MNLKILKIKLCRNPLGFWRKKSNIPVYVVADVSRSAFLVPQSVTSQGL